MPNIDINKKRGVDDAEISIETAWEDKYFRESINNLTIPVGFSLDGDEDNVFLDLVEEKHILAAGGMFSGLGMFRRTALLSLLIKNKPQFMKLIIIDPIYALKYFYACPILQLPATSKKSDWERVLDWCLEETEKRYQILLKKNNKKITGMPCIVVMISELGEIVQDKKSEKKLIRIMQMTKATGIHFIMTTQRPGSDIVTELIRKNTPAKIAFQVPTEEESKYIIYEAGAEKLIGQGDLLYKGKEYKHPLHLQGYSFQEEETGKLVKELCR